MLRAVLLSTLLLAACGDDSIATTDDGSGSSGNSSTTTTTGPTPTTGDETTTTTTSTGSDSDASSSAGDTTTTGTTTTTTTSTTDTTTQGIDTSSSSSTTTTTGTTADETTTTTTTGETTTTTTGETTDTTGDTGEVVGPPVPAGLCTMGQLTSFVEPMAQAEELHIIGVYQASGNALTVEVTRVDVPLTLVLSSYEPVAFTLNLAPGVLLEHVILNGYNAHTVQGQGAATVTDVSGQFNFYAACAYEWPEDDGGCNTPGLVAGAEAATGLSLTTFAACYEGSSFSLD
ncbi:hypothetical protein OV203_45920 [Nannocystis sp. ILAH1]|uniref:hypothetical protein n=1 Tax=unclassified Nannocystis TaxID=2627009 RepID=UPI0022719C07|nr:MULTISPECIES: hypothetical protein [unclassified Nannocystis]MCY0994549.1 hypothetical protein [Nannocystis sp. ILAH1]MCY1063184.1 hypothetical protein [Nannocystis sp. RBIL2]